MGYSLSTMLGSNKGVSYKTEILSGLTVAVALVPEAIAFAMIAGFSPLSGLYAAFVMGLVTSILGGRPAMISGATGAIAVIFLGLITELRTVTPGIGSAEIMQYVFATVVLGGLFQIAAGLLKLGKFIRLVPHPVMFGFVNGLAIIIFLSQMPTFTAIIENNAALQSLFYGGGVTGGDLFHSGMRELATMVGLVLLTILIIWKLPRYTTAVPASLVAIVVVSALVIFLGIHTTTVADTLNPGETIRGSFPPFGIPQIPFNGETLMLILPYAAILAGVGLIESLLTLNLIDEVTETRGNGNRECIAQGTANIASGFLSGMGGCAMIGQSLINTSSGARTRLSGIFASLMLLVFIMFGSGLIEKLPMAGLTGVMIMVAIGTFEWASFRTFRKMPVSDVFVMVLVTVITVVTHNLAMAVLTGIIFSALVFSWENAKRIRARKSVDEEGVKHYEIYGPLFFGSVKAFAEKFDPLNDPREVIIDFRESRITDMSAIEAVNNVTQRYRKQGKRVHLRHLSDDCKLLLRNADAIIDVNVLEDPTYKIPVNNPKKLIR
ncbi:MAG TPA: SulP family inorganic anion transporter [Proteiniphilum sp.]|nr:SulP family inorganic anion transporter [Proteiniphilum sp.]HPJ49371.1 SulP family inorganic anion transporter [Proteiniphilum sp.]HPR19523.1 SulP family inorganic anion transporter [Proteiniphilum sp.]